MSATELMGWDKNQKRWFKRHEGKLYAAGFRTLKTTHPDLVKDRTKEGTRPAANQWWRDKLSALITEEQDTRPHADYWHQQLAEHRARRQWLQSQGDEEGQAKAQSQVEIVEAMLKRPTLPDPQEWSFRRGSTIPADYESTAANAELWQDRLQRSTPKPQYSVTALVKRFIAHRRADKTLGITADRIYNISNDLQHFLKWDKLDSDDIRKVSGLVLMDFRSDMLKRADDEEASLYSVRDILASLKQFITWCWDTAEVIELPKNLKKLTIKIQPTTVKTWKGQDVEFLLKNCPERQKLWYLLMLNTGVGAYEISLLSNHDPNVSEDDRDDVYYSVPRINWREGTITRKRTKTKAYKGVPIVTHRLWPETMRLLRKLGSQKSNPVLTTEKGTPLVIRGELRGKEKDSVSVKRHDVIGREFRRLRKKLKKTQKRVLPSIKLLRHTAASRLDKNAEFARYTLYFLGHAPRGTAERHYIDPSREQFAQAMEWLGREFGVVS